MERMPTTKLLSMLLVAAVAIVGGCTSAHRTDPTGPTVPTSSTASSTTLVPGPTTTKITTTTTTTAVPVAPATEDSACSSGMSSRADFDPADGKYAAYLDSVNATTRVAQFDIIQFLVGSDAITAYHKANPSATGGPPNDYFIVNADVRIDKANVANNARFWVLDPVSPTSEAEAMLAQVSQAAASSGFRVYWLTFSDSQLTGICQQFTP